MVSDVKIAEKPPTSASCNLESFAFPNLSYSLPPVIATNKEPIPGWINNHYGPTGIVAGAGLGLLRSMHADPELVADMVPADNVINCIISAAWNVHQTW